MTETNEDILRALRESRKALTTRQVAEAAAWYPEADVVEALQALEAAGRVERNAFGVHRWAIANRATRADERHLADAAVEADAADPVRLAYQDGKRDAAVEAKARADEAERLDGIRAGTATLPFGSTLIAALEALWAEIQDRHPGVPDAIIITGSGAQRGGTRLGHTAHDLWTDEDGGTLTEIFISGERIADGPQGVLGTMLHEAAHGLNHYRSVKDTSANCRYHNRRFVATAQELGLETADEPHPSIGWSFTKATADLLATYETASGLKDWYLSIGPGTGHEGGVAGLPVARPPRDPNAPKTSGRLVKAVCSCPKPRIVRLSPAVLALGPITCGACGEDFRDESPG
jgi:predicted Zn-ribbon and HTH transcriptional regulator